MIRQVIEKYCLCLEFHIISSFNLGLKHILFSSISLSWYWQTFGVWVKEEKGFVKNIIFNILDVNSWWKKKQQLMGL